jgi:hypothetical protein
MPDELSAARKLVVNWLEQDYAGDSGPSPVALDRLAGRVAGAIGSATRPMQTPKQLKRPTPAKPLALVDMGNAQPRPCKRLSEECVAEHRRFDCARYGRCLTYAQRQRWTSFTCRECSHASR